MNNLFQSISKFWDSLGWLSNLIEIATAIFLIGSVGYGYWRSLKKGNAIRNKFHSVLGYVIETVGTGEKAASDLLATLRIAVVEDDPSDIPIAYLERLVRRVDVYTEVSLADVSRFEEYEVVFLDITGVVKEDLQKGGLSFLKKLRALEHSPLVIAVSSKKFDPTVTEFFKLADDLMKKPVTEMQCEEKLRTLISARRVPHSHAMKLDDLLLQAKLSSTSRQTLVHEIIAFLQAPSGEDELAEKLNRALGSISGSQAMALTQHVSRVTAHA